MRAFFRTRFQAWLERRLPPVSALTLSHRSIFIFPGREGWGFAGVLLLVFIGAVNYQNSLGHVLAFMLLALGHLAIHQTYRNLSGLRLRLGHAQPVFVGEEIRYPIILESTSGRRYCALGLGFEGAVQAWTDVEPDTEVVVRVNTVARRRGWHQPTRLYLETHYPLGMMRAWSWIAFDGACLVYPKPIAPPEIPDSGHGEATVQGRRERSGSEDYAGVRRYQPGDSLRQIDWKALARERGLFSKQFVEASGGLQTLDYEAFTGVEPELRLSYLCHLVLRAEDQGLRYALRLPGETLPSGLGAAHQGRCLRALALFGQEPVAGHQAKTEPEHRRA